MHRTSSRFWKCFDKLPSSIQKTADENFELLKNNPYHPSLHFKKIGSFWSVRIGLNYRLANKSLHNDRQPVLLNLGVSAPHIAECCFVVQCPAWLAAADLCVIEAYRIITRIYLRGR
jgi:hypothetical protein